MPVQIRLNLRPSAQNLEKYSMIDGMAEQALHLVYVEPGCHASLEVVVHAVSHGLERREHTEDPHVRGQVVQVDVGDPLLERHVALAVEEGQRALHEPLVAKRDVARLALRLLDEDPVEVPEHGDALARLDVGGLHAARDDGLVGLRQALRRPPPSWPRRAQGTRRS